MEGFSYLQAFEGKPVSIHRLGGTVGWTRANWLVDWVRTQSAHTEDFKNGTKVPAYFVLGDNGWVQGKKLHPLTQHSRRKRPRRLRRKDAEMGATGHWPLRGDSSVIQKKSCLIVYNLPKQLSARSNRQKNHRLRTPNFHLFVLKKVAEPEKSRPWTLRTLRYQRNTLNVFG